MSKIRNTSMDHPVASALREAGFLPLPRLWIRSEEMSTIHTLTNRYSYQVNQIRAEANRSNIASKPCSSPKTCSSGVSEDRGSIEDDPTVSKEAAWAAFERDQKSG